MYSSLSTVNVNGILNFVLKCTENRINFEINIKYVHLSKYVFALL